MKSTTEIADNRFLGSISTSSLRNLLPRRSTSSSLKNPKKTKSNAENTPPPDPNITALNDNDSAQFAKSPPSKSVTFPAKTAQSDAHPDMSKPLDLPTEKKEIAESDDVCEAPANADPAVKVVVRIRPASRHEKEGERTVRKVSGDTLCVGDRKFIFDSVLDSNSSQEDIFQLVGAPLVKNALAGYNTSIFSYGLTGSGKTYTMWGPPSAMLEDPSPRSHQGLVPRIFQMLFSEMHREQENPEGKKINYQCRCSFLEVYNEQIGDLLDPTQRNLEIRDDSRNGLYVENLTEEYVASYEEVSQILIKGLSSRKVGATTVNSKSSRSHIVFTFIIESWCKAASSKGFSSSKTSRISLVDLAGLDRNKLEDMGRQQAQEDKNVKKSLSQLGYLVNTLAKESPPDSPRDVPYEGSCLTRILRESLGGNAKLTVICNISPNRNTAEILSTLRFGQRVRFVKNEPVINEISEDDVNDLSDQIRQLKEELIRAKSDAYSSVGWEKGYFKGRNVRDSLNQLRVSLNRSLILPHIDSDCEQEVKVGEDDVQELCQQLDNLHSSCEENLRGPSEKRGSLQSSSIEEGCETDSVTEDEFINCPDELEMEEADLKGPQNYLPNQHNVVSEDFRTATDTSRAVDPAIATNSISISSCRRQSEILQEPTLSESPKIRNNQRKSMAISSFASNQNDLSESSKPEVLRQSLNRSDHVCSLRSSKIFSGPPESLAASIQRGLQIIDYHQRNSASTRSSVAFSFENLTLKPCPEADKANASVQPLPVEKASSDSPAASLLCSSCRQKLDSSSNEVQDSLKTWIVAVDEEKGKDVEKDSAKAIKREDELESVCKEQEAKIEELNLLLEQYKRERQNSAMEVGHESKILCLEAPTNEDQPEFIKEKCEIKEVQEVSDLGHGSNSFDINEKEALLKEIQTLKSKLPSYTATSPNKSTEMLRSSLLLRSMQLRKSVDSRKSSEEELERERERWMEMESEWISLTDELRVDLESNRCRAEKVEMELKLEKKCTEELDDALHRAVLGHARMVEHYAELQEKYNDLVGKHRAIMEGIAEVKRAAAKAGAKGHGARFAKSLAAELSALRVEREREKELLKKENKSLKIQLKDTAEAVHAAGELLVRLREAEQAASTAEENFNKIQEENEKLRKQVEKLKRKHKMEMITMKQYLAESRLPESALRPLYREDSDIAQSSTAPDDDQAWRAEFGAIYQEHHY